ncbi:hypothetical protein Patl1_31662 [Pistacia atlantica]|uniref:Uncharacterized protein n=1 Tax=Pistacia atlantica TaxID=434234 RepID=A0ACC1AMN8_9ROSI|nr:hypothetical protein Patl1_31662 [Pistacia atlantica]
MEQAKNKIFKAFDLGISSEKKKEEQEEAEILEKAKNEIYKAFGLVTSSQEQEEDQINTPPDHEADKPSPRNLDSNKTIINTSTDTRNELWFNVLSFSSYKKALESLSTNPFPSVIESSKLKELEDKWINLWEEQMQLSLKLSELILELRKPFSTEFGLKKPINLLIVFEAVYKKNGANDLNDNINMFDLKLRKVFSTEAINSSSPIPKGFTG